MITGWKEDAAGEPAKGGGGTAFVLGVFIALAAVYGAAGTWIQPPSPPPEQETPSW